MELQMMAMDLNIANLKLMEKNNGSQCGQKQPNFNLISLVNMLASYALIVLRGKHCDRCILLHSMLMFYR